MSTTDKPKRSRPAGLKRGSIKALSNGRYRIRWRSPEGKQAKAIVHAATIGEAVKWANRKHEEVLAARVKLRRNETRNYIDGAEAAPPPPKHSIVDCSRAYYAEQNADGASKDTLVNVDRYNRKWLKWCRDRGYAWLDQLDLEVCKAYADWLRATPTKYGRAPKASSYNQALKHVRYAVHAAIKLRRCPNLPYDDMDTAWKLIPISTRSEKKRHKLKVARALPPAEIAALLKACVLYDQRIRRKADETRYPRRSACIDVINLLVQLVRRREYTFSTCAQVSFDRIDDAVLHLPEHIAKGGAERWIKARGFTRIGLEVLELQLQGHKPGEWLSEHTYQGLHDLLTQRLPKYGAPAGVTSHVLRATGVTYQAALKGQPAELRALRAGHDIGQSFSSYFDALKGMVTDASSIEEAMNCKREFREALKVARTMAARRMARTEHRELPSRPDSQALRSDQDGFNVRHLNEALDKTA